MKEKLFLQLFSAFIFIIVVILVEEITCYFVIKNRGELENFKEYKIKHKNFHLYSLYLYKNKKYLFIVKSVLILFIILSIFLLSKNYIYYDSVGNNYKDTIKIIFYDKDGFSYSIDKNTKNFIDTNNNLTNRCHVDVNGNVSDIDENDLYISSISGIDYLLNGDIYFMNTNVYWDKNNQMHFFNENKDIIVNNYIFEIDVKTGDCSMKKVQ